MSVCLSVAVATLMLRQWTRLLPMIRQQLMVAVRCMPVLIDFLIPTTMTNARHSMSSSAKRFWFASSSSQPLVQYVLQYLPPTSILVDILRLTWVSHTVVGFLHFFWKRTGEDKRRRFSWARCASYDQTNSVRALKATLSTDINQWPGLIFSLSPSLLLREKVLPPLYQLSDTNTVLHYLLVWHFYWCIINSLL